MASKSELSLPHVSRRSFLQSSAAAVAIGASAISLSRGAAAQGTFPSKPIELLVPWGPGGGASTISDLMSKISAQEKLSPQPITLTHRPGASGLIGTALVADRRGDPYVFMPGGGALLPQYIVGEAKIHPTRNLTPLAMSCIDSSVVFTRHDSPFKTLADVIEKLKKEPRSVTMAGAGGGPGSWDGMLETVLGSIAGVQFNQIPFGGGGEVQAAILGGQIDVGTRQLSNAQELIKAKQVRALAIFDAERNPKVPDVPTMRELGYDAVLNLSRGWMAPAGLKPEDVEWYGKFFKGIHDSKQFQQFCDQGGIVNKYLGPADWKKFVDDNMVKIEALYRKMGVVK
jgi:putative tricarboxylic transport membrane protein